MIESVYTAKQTGDPKARDSVASLAFSDWRAGPLWRKFKVLWLELHDLIEMVK